MPESSRAKRLGSARESQRSTALSFFAGDRSPGRSFARFSPWPISRRSARCAERRRQIRAFQRAGRAFMGALVKDAGESSRVAANRMEFAVLSSAAKSSPAPIF